METTERKVIRKLNLLLKQEVAGDIHHYTNITGIKGIIEENELWASNCFYLNDKSEILHSFNLINDVIIKKFNDKPNEVLEIAKEEWSSLHRPNVYVTSFSKNRNSLSQWRAYGKHGDAYCISFNKICLSTCIAGIAEILDVIYDYEDQINLIDNAIDYFFDTILESQSQITPEQQCRNLFSLLSLFLPLFKHESFCEENEVRLVIREDSIKINNLKEEFRCNDGLLIPFIKLNYLQYFEHEDDFPISEIMIGPNKNIGIAEDSLFNFFRKRFNKEIVIYDSKIPYRM